MTLTTYFLCVSLIISAFFHLGDGVSCYRCNSVFNPGCGDPFDFSLAQTSGQLIDCDNQFGQNYPGSNFGNQGNYGNQFGQPGQPGQFGGQPGFSGQPGIQRTTTCSKTTRKSGSTWTVNRDCGPPGGSFFGSSSSSESCISEGDGYRCTCYGERCNGATKGLVLSWMTLALMAAFAFILSR